MALLWNMRRRKLLVAFFFSSFFLARNPCLAQADFIDIECLTVPSSVFANSIKATLDMVSKVTSIVAPFANTFGDRLLANAINDCLDLLDFDDEELSWSLSATQNPNGKDHNGTGDRRSDLSTWLSAALGNQDTCLDGFEGTNSFVKQVVAGSLNQLTSLVRDILGMVDQFPSAQSSLNSKSSGGKRGGKQHPRERKLKSIKQSQFPWWVKAKDRKLLQAGSQETGPDAVVAADGTGNFERVMDAVQAAPEYSTQRYVIYVKRGIYLENVEIKKKKWNLMLIGDGMDVTIISGNRSFIDGWTTFRSATFGMILLSCNLFGALYLILTGCDTTQCKKL
ncbi:Pectinesterase inhibitor domain [Dillenia turbinata]|uniref:Pectinesterase inhibitor domain n=1 Tax=Dillenia turbinata TaxID=194707 RepID=A0AAN8ZP80_9MAGN